MLSNCRVILLCLQWERQAMVENGGAEPGVKGKPLSARMLSLSGSAHLERNGDCLFLCLFSNL